MGEYNPGLHSPWVTVDEFLNCYGGEDENISTTDIAYALNIASNTLYILSGRQFRGIREQTVTVCKENCTNTVQADRCGSENEISIGYWPITDLRSIKFDGVEQLPARDINDAFISTPNFQINEYRYIEKLDGRWPTQSGQDFQEVVITFKYGITPPDAGKEAVKHMASEILDGMMKKECGISDRVTHITRRGTSLTIRDYDILTKDFIGISVVDTFIQTYNPTKTRIQSFVIQPGKTAKVRRKNT
jgi:hypothetical protein